MIFHLLFYGLAAVRRGIGRITTPSLQPETRYPPPMARLPVRPVEMKASHLELNVEPGSQFGHHSFF